MFCFLKNNLKINKTEETTERATEERSIAGRPTRDVYSIDRHINDSLNNQDGTNIDRL